MAFSSFRRQRLYFDVRGEPGESPVLLLHGFASDGRLNWQGTGWLDALGASQRRLLVLDFLGHGYSDKPHAKALYSRALMAADAVALLDLLRIEVADVIGYSMGAEIALRALGQAPARFRRAILGGWDEVSRVDRMGIARRLRERTEDFGPEAERFYRFAAARTVNDLDALAACIEAASTPLPRRALAEITTPTLVVTGERDHLAPHGAVLASRLARGRHLSVAGRDHMSLVGDRAFREAALVFLDE